MLLHVSSERVLVARVEVEGDDRVESVGLGDRLRDAWFRIRELHAVTAAFAEQAGYEGTDLAGTEYENVLHWGTPE